MPALTLAQVQAALATGFVPHNDWLGLRAEACGDNFAVFCLPYADKLVGNPETGVLHGGAVTALLDGTCGMAVFAAMPEPTRIATIDLRIDYLGPATPGRDVFCRAECVKLTQHVAFARAVAYHDEPSRPLATAVGTFMIFANEPSVTAAALEQP